MTQWTWCKPALHQADAALCSADRLLVLLCQEHHSKLFSPKHVHLTIVLCGMRLCIYAVEPYGDAVHEPHVQSDMKHTHSCH